jgi:hypothetical protein
MQIRVNKGVVEVKPTKLELKRLRDAYDFAESMPRGIGFDDELEAAAEGLSSLLLALDPPKDAPKE